MNVPSPTCPCTHEPHGKWPLKLGEALQKCQRWGEKKELGEALQKCPEIEAKACVRLAPNSVHLAPNSMRPTVSFNRHLAGPCMKGFLT